MNQPNTMTTLSEVLEKLRKHQIDNEFRWEKGGFTAGKGKLYQPKELKIVKTYRFEGDSNPDDSSVLYIIQTMDGFTGYSLDAYGAYSTHEDEKGYDDFLRQIPMEDREEQLIFR